MWSDLNGDLIGAENRAALDESIDRLIREASGPLQAVAHDLHPDFYSTHAAQTLAARLGIPAIAVQHHHAHIAVVQAEQAVASPVIGLALDGVGLGNDGDVWGGEVLWVDSCATAHRWSRLDHLAPLLLPGADVAAREPWRMAASVLHRLGRADEIEVRFGPVVGEQTARVVRHLLEHKVNSPSTTSAGRWFDAAAGALGVSIRQSVEAEAAMAIERLARDWLQMHPQFNAAWHSLDLAPLVFDLFSMGNQDAASVAYGAALFHVGLANGLAHSAIDAARKYQTKTVVFGGGCFLNRVLSERLDATLREAGLVVLRPQSTDCGDAGLALGQAWVAACSIDAGCVLQRTMES